MSLKKKLGLGVASAALGLSLIGGGTYAYFNDTATSTNTFAAGTLSLDVDPEVIFNVDNIKPGDYMYRTFELENNGSLDISKVLLETNYEVTDDKGDNGTEDFGDHIVVDFLNNLGSSRGEWDDYEVVYSTTLADLKEMTPDDLAKEWERFLWFKWTEDGIDSGQKDYFDVRISFNDNDQDQNIFQGDSLELVWKFIGEQTAGEHVRNN